MRPGDRADFGGGELAQIQGVGVTGVAAVGGEEPEQRHPLDVRQHRLVTRDSGGGSGHGQLAVMAGDPGLQRSKRPQPVKLSGGWTTVPVSGVQLSDAAIVAVAGAS